MSTSNKDIIIVIVYCICNYSGSICRGPTGPHPTTRTTPLHRPTWPAIPYPTPSGGPDDDDVGGTLQNNMS